MKSNIGRINTNWDFNLNGPMSDELLLAGGTCPRRRKCASDKGRHEFRAGELRSLPFPSKSSSAPRVSYKVKLYVQEQ